MAASDVAFGVEWVGGVRNILVWVWDLIPGNHVRILSGRQLPRGLYSQCISTVYLLVL
jgi:hypothetical protein